MTMMMITSSNLKMKGKGEADGSSTNRTTKTKKNMKFALTSMFFLCLFTCPTMTHGKKDDKGEDTIDSKGEANARNTADLPVAGTSIDNPYDCLIIGAGWSGISAGKTLLDGDITTNFGILEAKDYIGGRSHTVDGYFAPGVVTEIGSAWIYPKTNVADIVDDLRLQYSPTEFTVPTLGLYEEGYGKLDDFDKEIIIDDYFFSRFTPFAQKHSNDGTLTQIKSEFFQEEELVEYSDQKGTATGDFTIAEELSQNNKYRQGVNGMINENIVIEYGANLDLMDTDTSVNFLGCEYSIDFMGVPGGGYSYAIESLAAPFLDKIKLNTKVVEIDYSASNDNQKDDGETSSDIVIVKAIETQLVKSPGERDGWFPRSVPITYYARSTIVSVPLGVLQNQSIKFTPPLPQTKLTAINSIAMGNLNKCIMYWDTSTIVADGAANVTSWWPYDDVAMQLLTEIDSNSEDFTYFFNDQSQEGNEETYVLTSWIGGVAADQMELQSDEEILDHVMENLRSMVGTTATYPTNYIITRWRSDEYSRGAYSYDVQGKNSPQARNELTEPISDKVYFAGEHLSSEWWATAVGAYDTGVDAANKLDWSGLLEVEYVPPKKQEEEPICSQIGEPCTTHIDCCDFGEVQCKPSKTQNVGTIGDNIGLDGLGLGSLKEETLSMVCTSYKRFRGRGNFRSNQRLGGGNGEGGAAASTRANTTP